MDPEKALERVLLPLPHHRPGDIYNPLEPPSPHALARYLADIPPRPKSTPLDETDSGSGSNSTPSLTSSSTASCHNGLYLVPLPLLPNPTICPPQPQQTHEVPSHEPQGSSEALRNTIRGVYHLWKSARRTKSPTLEEEFLEIVRQVIAE